MIAAPVQCDVDVIPKGSHYISVRDSFLALYVSTHMPAAQQIDQVIDNYLSTSFAAPELFGTELDEFRAELTEELRAHTDKGFFWEWPGDTEVLIARKRRSAQ
jgi:hypothetical protein